MLPAKAKVVVIGGGVAGCSVAYHLAKYGWKDTILLERDQLTSGTTWHAAGLVGQLGASATITRLRKYSLNLYKELEKKNWFINWTKTKWCNHSCKHTRKITRIVETSNCCSII